MRYHYDNSAANPRNPNHPPKRVEAGNRATDELAHLWLQIMPESPHESRRVYADAWAKREVAKNPRNYAADLTMGALALANPAPLRKRLLQFRAPVSQGGKKAEAIENLEMILKKYPDDAAAKGF